MSFPSCRASSGRRSSVSLIAGSNGCDIPSPGLYAPCELRGSPSSPPTLGSCNARLGPSLVSLQNPLHHIPMHIRQPHVPPLEPIRQPQMIDHEQMQNRRLQIPHRNDILDRVVPKLIRLPIRDP